MENSGRGPRLFFLISEKTGLRLGPFGGAGVLELICQREAASASICSKNTAQADRMRPS